VPSGVAQSMSWPKVPATHFVSVSQESCSVSARVTVNNRAPVPLTQPPSCITGAGPRAVVITPLSSVSLLPHSVTVTSKPPNVIESVSEDSFQGQGWKVSKDV